MKKLTKVGFTLAVSALLAPSLLAAQESPATTLQKSADVTNAESAGAVRPTVDLGWIVHVRPEPSHSASLQRLGELRCKLAASESAFDRKVLREQFDEVAALLVDRGSSFSGAAREEAHKRGLVVRDTMWLTPGFVIAPAAAELRESLLAHPDVISIQKATWHLPQIGTAMNAQHHDGEAVHAMSVGGVNLKGVGVEIAVLDSGIDLDMNGIGRPHKAFFANGNPLDLSGGGIGGSRVQTSYLAGAGIYWSGQVPEDIHGHGTRVTSTISAAKWSLGLDVADSFASDAHLHNFKISDDGFAGAPASVIAMSKALQHAVLNPSIRIANLSYDGSPAPASTPNPAIDSASNAGVFVTLSAGNGGTDLTFAHGAYNGMVVGGSYEFTPAPYFTSAIGPLTSPTTGDRRYPDMLAVGDQITTAQLDNEAKYQIGTGTSLSAGFVAGSAALILQADPSLSPVEIKALLLNNTWAVSSGNPDAAGLGYLRTKESVEATLAGDVTDGWLNPDGSLAQLVTLAAGQQVRYTLAWERVAGLLAFGLAEDFDLRVYGPSGSQVAFSASPFDVEETVSFTAPVAGSYRIVVANDELTQPGLAVHFALSGPGVGACSLVQVKSVSPATSPAVTTSAAPNMVTLSGCGLDTVTDVRIAGISVAFGASGSEALTMAIPLVPVFGSTMVELTHPGGVAKVSLEMEAVDPLLDGTMIAPSYLMTDVLFASKPGDLHIITFSLSEVASSLPGLLLLDIGANFTDLTIATQQIIAPGQAYGVFSIPPFSGTLASPYYLQSVVIEAGSALLPLPTSNVHMIQFVP